jgi:MFS family permease
MDKPKLWGKEFIFLLLVSVVNFSAFSMVTPLMPGFSVSMGATLSAAGLITGMFSVVALVGRPFSGVIGDKLNKKYALIASLTLNGFITLLYGFAPSIGFLILIRIAHGLAFSVSSTVALALGADYIPKERMGEGVGFLGMGQIIGVAIGPNMGIILVDLFSYQLSFLVSGSVIMVAGLSVLTLRYNPAKTGAIRKSSSLKASLRPKNLVAVELLPNAAFVAIFMLGHGLTASFLVMIGDERGISGIGLYFVVNAIIVLITRPLMGRMTDRKGVAFAIVPGYLLSAAAMILIGSGYHLFIIGLAAVLFAIGAGSAMPAIQADCLRRLDRARSTVATGTYMIGLDIGMTVGPMLGGVIADAHGFRATFTSAAFLMLAGFCVYLVYNKLINSRNGGIANGKNF